MARKPSHAEIIDRGYQTTALMLFALSLIFAGSAAEHWAGDRLDALLAVVTKGLAAMIILVGIWMFVQKWRTRDERSDVDSEGFVANTFRYACTISWAVTFILLSQSDRVLAMLPNDVSAIVYGELVLAVMGISFSIAFFVRSFAGGGGADSARG